MVDLISKKLLNKEIKRLSKKTDLDEHEKFWLSLCKKELLVLNRFSIEGIDLRGEIQEVEKRLNNQSIYFMERDFYESLVENAKKYYEIEKIVKGVRDSELC